MSRNKRAEARRLPAAGEQPISERSLGGPTIRKRAAGRLAAGRLAVGKLAIGNLAIGNQAVRKQAVGNLAVLRAAASSRLAPLVALGALAVAPALGCETTAGDSSAASGSDMSSLGAEGVATTGAAAVAAPPAT